MEFQIITNRLVIRHLRNKDTESLLQVFSDPEVMRFGFGVQNREWVTGWLNQRIESDYPKQGYGPYAVVLKSTGILIGYCGLFLLPDIDGQPEIEIGYRLAQRFWRKGYATEAAQAVKGYAFSTLGMTRLIALIDPANKASIRVAEKIGMNHEKDVLLGGYSHPDHLYAVMR